MTKWTYARRFVADEKREALTVPFGYAGWSGAVGCLIPGCHWTHPTRDEAAMTGHARREWEGMVEYSPAPLVGYVGPHTAGEGCACGPRVAVRSGGWSGERMTAVLVHNSPEETMYGPAAQRVIEQSQRMMSGEVEFGG